MTQDFWEEQCRTDGGIHVLMRRTILLLIDKFVQLFSPGYDRSKYSSITDVLNKPRNDGYNCLHLAVKHDHEKVLCFTAVRNVMSFGQI